MSGRKFRVPGVGRASTVDMPRDSQAPPADETEEGRPTREEIEGAEAVPGFYDHEYQIFMFRKI